MADETPVEPVSRGMTYRDAGVDIDAGNEVVERIRDAVVSTQDDRVLKGSHGAFGGYFRLLDADGSLFGNKLRDPILVGATDGVGTKLKVAFECGVLDSVGIDLVAMCVNDLVVGGARPLFFLDYVATGKISPDAIATVVEGIAEGCRRSGCALLGGETAEMPGFYADDELDLAGFSVGVVERDSIIDGSSVEVGDGVIGIASSGIHSNGFSLVRKALLEGSSRLQLDEDPAGLGCTLAEALLEPTRIYVRPLLDLIDRVGRGVHAIAHITGGGLVENIPRVLPEGIGCRLDRSTWSRPAIFSLIEERGAVARQEMDRVFNQGIGMVVVTGAEDVSEALDRLVGSGEQATVIGEIVPGEGVEIN
ncbi:MAG: phosphoribosylformylglycinamidine cyclo-ligase [Bacillota bacterium]|nr:MAG: phosphoribosylformylglycinamidine cyclo-ligase [Planctomycetota bacterium]RUA10379.1 MAG: phosphoribosylformylglycinamidine cyclo-ligase [Bacillota bacterium]